MSEDSETSRARGLVERRFPDVRVGRCELIPGGWDNIMLLVNEEWIFRIPRRPDGEGPLAKEVALLSELARTLPVPVPRFERVWRGDETPRIIAGYRRLSGQPAAQAVARGRVPETIGTQLAEFLTALHAFPIARARALGVPGGDATSWRGEYEDFYRWIQRETFRDLGARERRWASRLCEDFLATPSHFRFTPVLLHRDLGAEHILHDEATGRITGIIDWGDAWVGDPAFDFTGLLADWGEVTAEAALAHYNGPKDAGMMDRARFYAQVIPFYGIIYGRKFGHEEWRDEGFRRLRALVG